MRAMKRAALHASSRAGGARRGRGEGAPLNEASWRNWPVSTRVVVGERGKVEAKSISESVRGGLGGGEMGTGAVPH